MLPATLPSSSFRMFFLASDHRGYLLERGCRREESCVAAWSLVAGSQVPTVSLYNFLSFLIWKRWDTAGYQCPPAPLRTYQYGQLTIPCKHMPPHHTTMNWIRPSLTCNHAWRKTHHNIQPCMGKCFPFYCSIYSINIVTTIHNQI